VPAISLWAARPGGLVRARPEAGPRPDFLQARARPPPTPKSKDQMPKEPDEEPELPLFQAIVIAVLLWVALAALFLCAMYWL